MVVSRGECIPLFSLFFFYLALFTSHLLIATNFPHNLDALDCYWLLPLSLLGFRLLQQASEKREEARKLEVEAQNLETVGWGKALGGCSGV